MMTHSYLNLQRLEDNYTADISPPSPRFFQFVFPKTTSKYVLLEVFSEDTVCMTVSVQNMSVSIVIMMCCLYLLLAWVDSFCFN